MELFPSTAPRPTTSEAERLLHSALRKANLPGWRAWHSLRLRVGSAWEGEGDFVVASPAHGLLVLEVKGGLLELRDGRWLQNGSALQVAPRDQAQGFVRNLVAALEARGVERPPFGVALAFPDCDFSEGPSTGELIGLVLGRRDLPHLDQALPALMEAAVPPFRVPRGARWMDALTELWGKTWAPTVRLSDRVADAAEQRVALDAEQLQFLEMASGVQRALVEGGAGTGKTLLATELCRRRVREGRRAQYLCFTDALARAVEGQFAAEAPASAPRPVAASIRQYARKLLVAAGHAPPARPGAEFWKEVSLQAACDALPSAVSRPDVVVVDEAQDFEVSDWMLVEQLVGSGGLWVFRDVSQAFWRERELPPALSASLAPLRLVRQYRCPEPLWTFASRDATGSPTPPEGPRPDKHVLRAVAVPGSAVVERVRHELDSLRREGVAPSDIAILSLSGQARSGLFGLPRLGSHALAHADAPEAARSVVADTFLRFKGLERPFTIVAELSGDNVTRYETRMHIALTRATVGAIVVADEATARADPRLGWLLR